MIAAVALPPVAIPAPAAPLALAGSLPRQAVRIKIRHARLNVLVHAPASASGTLVPQLPGREVLLQELGRHGWHTLAHASTGRRGRFTVRYTPRSLADRRLRLRFAGDSADTPARRPLGRLNVYRLAGASWYGGGGSLACGGYLTSSTMGVANKTLPCGTPVTLRYDGRSVRVPVVDRGPYVAGRDFDLTEATKRALGFGGTGMVWSSR